MSQETRIISLVPSATEIVYLLGLGSKLVGRSHDSNYPSEALSVPIVSTPAIEIDVSSKKINEQVKNSVHNGVSLFHLDQNKLEQLKPTVILTQELCKVCAPSFTQVHQAVRVLEGDVEILSLEPESIDDMLENIIIVGRYTNTAEIASQKVAELKQAVNKTRNITKNLPHPTVIVIEWLDPLMVAGHWVPEMIEIAGGQILLSKSKDKSSFIDWEQIVEANPDILIVAPCGFNIERTKKELHLITNLPNFNSLKAIKNNQLHLIDGDAYITRSGPRLVEGVIKLSKIIHPKVC